MKSTSFAGQSGMGSLILLPMLCVCLVSIADQVEMQNGDRYVGKVSSLTPNTLIFQSEMLGKMQLPRSKVATVTFGENSSAAVAQSASTSSSQPQIAPTPAKTPNLSESLRELGSHSNLIQQVQSDFLSAAGPEANNKFNNLMTGLTTGNMNLEGLRAEAKSAADQLRDLKTGLGEEAGSSLDSYLSILDNFLKESANSGAVAAKAPTAATPKPKAKPVKEEE